MSFRHQEDSREGVNVGPEPGLELFEGI
jgi:hypothetical protein